MKQTVKEAEERVSEGSKNTGKELPDTIYLQFYGDGDVDNVEEISYENVTWCEDRIYPTDVQYAKVKSPWISVEERLPEEGQRVLVGFFYYYKYADREAETRKYVDFFTYENGIWTNGINRSYRGKEVSRDDIKVICWMSIPSFDDILDANKDVLKRIKKEGD